MSNIKDTAKDLYDSLQMSLATMDPGTAKVLGGAAGGLAGGAVGAIGNRRGRIGRMIALGLLGTAAGAHAGENVPEIALGGLVSAAESARESRQAFLARLNALRASRRAISGAAAGGLNLLGYPSEAEYRAAKARGDLRSGDDVQPGEVWKFLEKAVDKAVQFPTLLSEWARRR